jgi:hypothetical protein
MDDLMDDMVQINNVRHWFTRTKVISDTDYLSAGKPMMDVFFIGVSGLTVIAKYSSLVLCYTIIGVRFFSFAHI